MTNLVISSDTLKFDNSGVNYGAFTGGSTDGLITLSSNAGNVRLAGLQDPVGLQDAATKYYTDSLVVSPQALTKTDDTNVTLTLGGSPSISLFNPTSLTLGWTGTLSGTRGGTGVNNGSCIITLGGSLTTSGAFDTTLITTGITSVTLPTSGTLLSTASGTALTKTDDTNVTLTLGGSPSTALINSTSLTLGWTGQLGLSRGGTNASLTASNGGIFYSTASAGAILNGTATANQVLLSGSSTVPSWSTATYPSTTASNGILYSSGTDNVTTSSSLTYNGTTLTNSGTTASTSSSTGTITTAGGIGISNTTDATSLTNGGTITTTGGAAIAKKLYLGDNLIIGTEATTKTISTPDASTANTAGGSLNITAGNGNGSAATGGSITIAAGAGGISSGNGGAISIAAGLCIGTSKIGGALTLKGGASIGSGGSVSGSVILASGDALGSAVSGTVTIQSSDTGSASSGNVSIVSGNSTTSGNSGSLTLNTGTVVSGTVGTIIIQTGGTTRSNISTTSITNTVPTLGPSGLVSAPSYSFSSDATTGMYSSATNILNFASGGVNTMTLQTGGVSIPNSIAYVTGTGAQTISAVINTQLTSTYWNGTFGVGGDTSGTQPTFSNGVITVNKTGKYYISYSISFTNGSTGSKSSSILVSGTGGLQFGYMTTNTNSNDRTGMTGSTLLELSASTTIYINVYSSSTVNMDAAVPGIFTIYRVG